MFPKFAVTGLRVLARAVMGVNPMTSKLAPRARPALASSSTGAAFPLGCSGWKLAKLAVPRVRARGRIISGELLISTGESMWMQHSIAQRNHNRRVVGQRIVVRDL
jgi:hypothetical protein